MTARRRIAGVAMAGHSRAKDGVASLAYVPAIHELSSDTKDVEARDKPGHDEILATPAIVTA
ncbi:hypothetical protein [Bradyrhizobium sp. CCBAU 51627]|uniref:hypothetical protein n=1 Tax=Bradyrhizobium sp. CCBAU 51627 TaxID=1325088 RepID=UPI002304E529|nr:hypothetical protein [Bradyrhizobium sp. CCBAU 51627]